MKKLFITTTRLVSPVDDIFRSNTHRRWNHLKINELTLPELKGQILPIQTSLQASQSDIAVEEDRSVCLEEGGLEADRVK